MSGWLYFIIGFVAGCGFGGFIGVSVAIKAKERQIMEKVVHSAMRKKEENPDDELQQYVCNLLITTMTEALKH